MHNQRNSTKRYSIKARSKREVCFVLIVESDLFLPSIYHPCRAYLKGIMRAYIEIAKTQMTLMNLSNIQPLSNYHILKFANEDTLIETYLHGYENYKISKSGWNAMLWIFFKQKFSSYIFLAIKRREKLIILNCEVQIKAVSEIV